MLKRHAKHPLYTLLSLLLPTALLSCEQPAPEPTPDQADPTEQQASIQLPEGYNAPDPEPEDQPVDTSILPDNPRKNTSRNNSTERSTDSRPAPASTDTPPSSDRLALLHQYRDILLSQPQHNYRQVGSVLEALVLHQLKQQYDPETHQVSGGVQYANAQGRTLGELDIIVIHRESGDIQLVGEVKLSGNLDRAERDARSQLHRLRTSIEDGSAVRFLNKEQEFNPDQFQNITQYHIYGPRGAIAAGWDGEVDLTRSEGDQLQDLVLQAQQ